MTDTLPIEIARRFLLFGIAVVPIAYRSKQPEVRWKEYQSCPPMLSDLDGWFGGSHLKNLGIICGWRGLTVIDFDTFSEFEKWRLWARKKGSTAKVVCEQAYKVRSSRGVHVYVRLTQPDDGRNLGKVQVLGKMDIKGKGGYVLGPGSVHPSGAIYTPLQNSWVFPAIGNLSDVLPATMLVQHTELPSNVNVPVFKAAVQNVDPWEIADQAGSLPSSGLIDDIRAKIRIESFFQHTERTSNDGRWLRTVCPFHDDKSPSFWLDTQRQICGCFSSQCRAHGKPLDVINLFGMLFGLDNIESIHQLRKRL